MLISKGDLEWYRSALIDIGEQAAQSVRESLESSSGSISEMREDAIDSIITSIGIYGDQAQALAGQLFDEVCAAEGIGANPFELFDDIIDLDMLAGKVRYFARSLVESNKVKYLDDCSLLADFYARRCNYESMIRNCYKNNVRYARVPTGPDTCDFCLMLASRGFVYYDQARAEEGSHRACDCVIIPGNGADATSATQIEGYDPELLYDLWQGQISDTAHKRASKNGTSYQVERMRIMDRYSRGSKNARARKRLR